MENARICSASPTGIYQTDTAGACVYINQRGQEIMGLTAEESLGSNWLESTSPEDRPAVDTEWQRFLREGRDECLLEYRFVRPDGTVRWVQDRVAALYSEASSLLGYVGTIEDITERKRAEEALRQAKEAAEAASRAKSEFMAMMSHELRTPLHIILGYTELLADGAGDLLPAEALASVRKVHTKASELAELISAVLSVSRLETDQLSVEVTSVSVAELLAELARETHELQAQSGLDFVWQVAEPLPALETDPGKLKVILKNLLGNAVKFTAQGQVTVSVQGRPGGVELRVADTGIGIPADALGVIFEPFRQVDSSNTRQYGGVGLGLHIVKRLVELLGGTVTVESAVGRGTTFCVWLPTGTSERQNGATGRLPSAPSGLPSAA